MRRVIDLTLPVEKDHFRWPVERRLLKDFAKGHPHQVTWAGWNVHSFTHIDAPRHMNPEGYTTDGIALDILIGEAAVVDLTSVPADAPVTRNMIDGAGSHVRKGDRVLLKSGWDRRASIDTPDFWLHAPYMTDGACDWLYEREIVLIGFDFPQDYPIRYFVTGQERAPLSEYPTHSRLLVRGIPMIEYLCNMTEVRGRRTQMMGLPVKLPESDGAPIRVVAIEED